LPFVITALLLANWTCCCNLAISLFRLQITGSAAVSFGSGANVNDLSAVMFCSWFVDLGAITAFRMQFFLPEIF
jgi:hypothetical protein